MDILENITNQFSNYKRGLLTWTETLENVSKIVQAEMPRSIEYRKGNNGKWACFTDRLYNQAEADDLIFRLNENTAGLQFRAVMH